MHHRKTRTAFCLAIIGLSLIACSENDVAGPGDPPVIAVATVDITPGRDSLVVRQTASFEAVVRSATGDTLRGRAITWASSNTAIADVSSTGRVQALAPGEVTISAASEGRSGSATVVVFPRDERLAYAWADRPNTAQYEPSALYRDNSSGGTITIRRQSTGIYAATFTGLGRGGNPLAREHIQVSAYFTPNRCKVQSWGGSPDLAVWVHCFTPGGARVDAYFTVLVAGAQALDGRAAFAWIDDPAASGGSPSARYAYNSTRGDVRVNRIGAGRHDVTFTGLGRTGGAGSTPEIALVTAYGSSPEQCRLLDWQSASADVTVRVACSSGTVATDAMFDLLIATAGRSGKRFGFMRAENPTTASYTPSAAYSANSSGGANTVVRDGTGDYRIRFGGLAKSAGLTETILISAYQGVDGDICNIHYWTNAGNDLEVNVRCYDNAGAAIDRMFTAILIE